MSNYHLRWLIKRDVPEVVEIDKVSHWHNWDEEKLVERLRQRNCIGMVVEHGEKVVGFMVYTLHEGRIHLIRLAVDPCYRNSGIGKLMMDRLKRKLDQNRRTRIVTQVNERNLESALFLRSMGFHGDLKDGRYRFLYRLGVTCIQ